jgi:hypothetical protein
VKGEKWWEQ